MSPEDTIQAALRDVLTILGLIVMVMGCALARVRRISRGSALGPAETGPVAGLVIVFLGLVIAVVAWSSVPLI
jgi:hypothetical protein